MSFFNVVIDTNVIISALRSSKGNSHRLLRLIGDNRFKINLSVPVVLEYESVIKRNLKILSLTDKSVDVLIDYLCSVAHLWDVHFLWRPLLSDPSDDMILELAVRSGSEYIITWNIDDFKGVEAFGVKAINAKEFLELIGEVK
jgi:putative PIN family toxin of toxin-antitoxin system